MFGISRLGVCKRYAWGEVSGLRVGWLRAAVNTTFVVYRVGNTWIDCGPCNQWDKVCAFAEERPPSVVLLTHHHEDHSGNAYGLKTRFGARILAPKKSIGLLRDGFPVQPYRRLVWGRPHPVQAETLADKIEDDGGHTWQVVPAPGHCQDMVCILQPQRGWLFSADLYVASKIRYARLEDRLSLEIASLRRVLELDFDTMFCAHRGMIERPHRALASKLDYLLALREQVYELWCRGFGLKEIRGLVLGREDVASYLSGFHFCKAHLILACIKSALADKGNALNSRNS